MFTICKQKEADMSKTSPEIASLKEIMKRHSLTMSDLKEEIGSKSTVSLILSGQRNLRKPHIDKLCARFQLSPLIFFNAAAAKVFAGRRSAVPRRNLFDPTVEPEESIEDSLLANVAIEANRKGKAAHEALMDNLARMIEDARTCESS